MELRRQNAGCLSIPREKPRKRDSDVCGSGLQAKGLRTRPALSHVILSFPEELKRASIRNRSEYTYAIVLSKLLILFWRQTTNRTHRRLGSLPFSQIYYGRGIACDARGQQEMLRFHQRDMATNQSDFRSLST